MQDRKTAEAGEKPPRAYRKKKGLSFGKKEFFVGWKKKNVGWRKKCQRSGMTGLNLRRRTVSRNGNIRRCHAEGPGFESRRDQYLN